MLQKLLDSPSPWISHTTAKNASNVSQWITIFFWSLAIVRKNYDLSCLTNHYLGRNQGIELGLIHNQWSSRRTMAVDIIYHSKRCIKYIPWDVSFILFISRSSKNILILHVYPVIIGNASNTSQWVRRSSCSLVIVQHVVILDFEYLKIYYLG